MSMRGRDLTIVLNLRKIVPDDLRVGTSDVKNWME